MRDNHPSLTFALASDVLRNRTTDFVTVRRAPIISRHGDTVVLYAQNLQSRVGEAIVLERWDGKLRDIPARLVADELHSELRSYPSMLDVLRRFYSGGYQFRVEEDNEFVALRLRRFA